MRPFFSVRPCLCSPILSWVHLLGITGLAANNQQVAQVRTHLLECVVVCVALLMMLRCLEYLPTLLPSNNCLGCFT
jgi:hypothetical protein